MSNNSDFAATMYECNPAVAALNTVPGFDPLKLMSRRRMPGAERDERYLDFRYKKLWFRLAHKKGRIRLNKLSVTEQFAMIEAQVYLELTDAVPVSSFTATCTREEGGDRYIESAQIQAMDQALTDAGFGLQFVPVPIESAENTIPQTVAGSVLNAQGAGMMPEAAQTAADVTEKGQASVTAYGAVQPAAQQRQQVAVQQQVSVSQQAAVQQKPAVVQQRTAVQQQAAVRQKPAVNQETIQQQTAAQQAAVQQKLTAQQQTVAQQAVVQQKLTVQATAQQRPAVSQQPTVQPKSVPQAVQQRPMAQKSAVQQPTAQQKSVAPQSVIQQQSAATQSSVQQQSAVRQPIQQQRPVAVQQPAAQQSTALARSVQTVQTQDVPVQKGTVRPAQAAAGVQKTAINPAVSASPQKAAPVAAAAPQTVDQLPVSAESLPADRLPVAAEEQTRPVTSDMAAAMSMLSGKGASDTLPVTPESAKAEKKAESMPEELPVAPTSVTAAPAAAGTAASVETIPTVSDVPAADAGAGQAAGADKPYTETTPVEQILPFMTLEEAKKVVVPTGTCRGWTLDEVAQRRRPSLRFYLSEGYQGKDNILRAAARLVLDDLEKKAG